MKRFLRWGGLALAVVAVVCVAAGIGIYVRVRGALPRLDGEVVLAGLESPVQIEYDAHGVPALRGAGRHDIARATGFVHAQNRFFQMDLLRRHAAGELAALLGPPLVDTDRAARVHRFRARARRALESAPEPQRRLLEAYADGVNAGIADRPAPPFEYQVLRTDPEPWRPEDSVLVIHAMYLELGIQEAAEDSAVGLLHDLLPAPLAAFLSPAGTEWDAPIVGSTMPTPPMPGSEVIDLRPAALPEAARARAPRDDAHPAWPDPAMRPGSNNWAIGAARTASGRAILANDTHLPLRVPGVWYRASFEYQPTGWDDPIRVTGATLPGVPPVILGSNGHVAWGFTNSQGSWVDLVVVEPAPDDPGAYLTPEGARRFEIHQEIIEVAGADPVTREVRETIWGPLYDVDHLGRPRALSWIAHDPQGANLEMVGLETARSLEELFDVSSRCGAPPQNIVAADRDGRVGWSIMGAIPRRFGFAGAADARRPRSWADGAHGRDGWYAAPVYPRVILPPTGRVWTANARVVDGPMLDMIGDGGYDLGARAGQIRDALIVMTRATLQDMLVIQLDDTARFLTRWRDLLIETIDTHAIEIDPRRGVMRALAEAWGGRAAIDSAGYRMVRAFRLAVAEEVFGALTAPCRAADDRFRWHRIGAWEGPLWRLVTDRPMHMLPPPSATWDQFLLAAADKVIADLSRQGDDLAARTWGERNMVALRHPFSAVPFIGRRLDLPARSLPGDSHMPRVQSPGFGAAQRMAVSPGREEDGYFHMPAGQCGHPLSPWYDDGHDAWAEGRPTSFLPGPPRHLVTLIP